jgi:Flp pilus assembly protein TadD
MNRPKEAEGALAKAVELVPRRARVRYNYSLVLRRLGRRFDSEREMLKAHHLNQRDPGIVHALAIFYAQEERWEEALAFSKKLTELAPGALGPLQLMQQIEEELSGVGASR